MTRAAYDLASLGLCLLMAIGVREVWAAAPALDWGAWLRDMANAASQMIGWSK